MVLDVKGHEIELYDTTQNLPILRFQKFNKYMMIGAQVGSTFQDYDQRTAKTLQFLQKGMTGEAIQELVNRRQTVFNAFNEYDPMGKAFAVLVKRIDNKKYKGYTSEDLDKVLAHLDKIGLGKADSVKKLIEVKKKSNSSLLRIIQNTFRRMVIRITQR